MAERDLIRALGLKDKDLRNETSFDTVVDAGNTTVTVSHALTGTSVVIVFTSIDDIVPEMEVKAMAQLRSKMSDDILTDVLDRVEALETR